jgi:surface carbohydrate biosynthesis protein
LKRYITILQLFLKAKLVFKNPKYHEIVIFDDETISDLKNVIHNYNFFVLQTRTTNINKVYLSLKILKFFFKNYKGNILTAYLISLLEIMKPKVVLTNIDNSFKFFDIARILDKKMKFVAIQNAARTDLKEHEDRFNKKITKLNYNKKFYIPNFLCFGQFEIDDYKYHRIDVQNFFKVGSLRLANFLHHISKNKIQIKKFSHDICLISEPAIARDIIYGQKGIEESAARTVKFTIKFCIKHNMKLIFAMKRDQKSAPEANKKELDYFKKYLSDNEFEYLVKHSSTKKGDISSGYSSYMSMLQSKVTIGYWSTLLRENLTIGGKILCCNLLPTNIWDFPIKGICWMKNCSFDEFEKRLLEIYSMPEKDYFSKLDKNKDYTISYDKNISTIQVLRRKIDFFLSNNYFSTN